ncbi:MAG: polysaccharide biosynthesis protein [Pseudomonadota bacterium]
MTGKLNKLEEESLFAAMLSAPRAIKRFISVAVDCLLIPLTIIAAASLRLGALYVPDSINESLTILLTTLVTVFIFARVGLYRAILRYLSTRAMGTVILAVSVSAILLAALQFVFRTDMPRSVPFIYWALTTIAVGGSRFTVRAYIQRLTRKVKTPVVIYGAGAAGSQLATALSVGHEYDPIAFIDDNPELQNSTVQGLTIFPPKHLPMLISRHQVSVVLLALPSISAARRREIILSLEPYNVKVQTIAGMSDLVSGKARIEEVRDLDIEDLLSRDPVQPNVMLLSRCIATKNVMVTGAGGSIGAELCRQVLQQAPAQLILLEQSEYALYTIQMALEEMRAHLKLNVEIIPLLGSVQNRKLMHSVMKSFAINTVYHAAAYKHVPMVEYNMIEGVNNNVFGTWNTAMAAIEAGVESFVLISTDKAVHPTNLMGATKRMAELCLQALAEHQTGTRFCMVRFGNVLGSSGSVVPLFKEQIRMGGPVTVTHPEVRRYFMTIPEAAQLVIQAGSMGLGGDVYVLDMGEPIKIADLAKQMIHLMGLTVRDETNKNGDIEIRYTGLRPGEKMHEGLLIGDDVTGTDHPRILRASEVFLPYKELVKVLDGLRQACAAADCDRLRQLMCEAPIGYTPTNEICDHLCLMQAQTSTLHRISVREQLSSASIN